MTTNTRARKAAAATATATANITARKAAASKQTPAKKAVPAHVTKQAKEIKETLVADKPKKEQTFEERDWTYLDEKDPSEQHVILAKEINRRTNLEEPISAKHVQAVLAMFPHFQRSATNKARSGYVPLAAEIVEKRSEHMILAHKEAREVMDGLQAAAAKKTAPATKKVPAKAPAKKAATKPAASKAATAREGLKAAAAKKAPARKARVTKTAAPVPASMDSSNEAF